MILASITDPKPTEAEIREQLLRLSGWPEGIRRSMGELSWKSREKTRDPNAFLVPFVEDVQGYEEYRRSPTWRRIRKAVLKKAKSVCACCGGKATQVHHRDYRPRVLSGEDLAPLVPLCKSCHKRVHYNENERKRTSWNEAEAVLAEMVARNPN